MIETGMLLGKYIPMEMLAQMPLPFVHRLRDIRIKQLDEARRKQEIETAKIKTSTRMPDVQNRPSPNLPKIPAIDDSALDDLVDELSM